MRTRFRSTLLVVALLSLVGIVVYTVLATGEHERRKLESTLEVAISKNQSGETDVLDFASLAPFQWDRLYIFGPYTPVEHVDLVLRRFWISSRLTDIESSDRIALLVFTKNGHVVQYLEFPRSQGDFSLADNGIGYARDEARFVVDKQGRIIRADQE